jgi:hypothetical protein
MPDHISGLPGRIGMEAYGAMVPAGRPMPQASGPAVNNLLHFIAQQVAQFTQSHLASHANHFAAAQGYNDHSHQMDLGQLLQGFAQQLAHAMQGGNHGTHGLSEGSKFSDAIKNNGMRAEQEVADIKEQSRLNEMVDAARMEAKKAKEAREWILQNL